MDRVLQDFDEKDSARAEKTGKEEKSDEEDEESEEEQENFDAGVIALMKGSRVGLFMARDLNFGLDVARTLSSSCE